MMTSHTARTNAEQEWMVNRMADYMDKQKAADLLDNLIGMVEDNQGNDYNTALKMGIEALKAQRWIPCSERLPENERKTYWVCTDTEYQCECRWTNVNHFWPDLITDWHWHIMDIPRYTEVVAWMPLPEPYKGGEQND